jgi:RNA polymerase sigma-70 factor (ECF subfamily)
MNVTDESSDRLACLMRSAQAGDGAAYAELLRDVVPALRGLVRARRRFLQASDIEDIVQEILLSLHAVRATYDPRRPFMPWLNAIAHNRIADSGRRHLRQAAGQAAVTEYAETFEAFETNELEEAYGDPEALRQAIAQLPVGQRRAIEAVKLNEMSLREASVATGMSVSALKVAVHRGIRSLRLTLDSRG